MSIGLLAKKIGMTQIFDPEGRQIPVTVLEAGPCFVTSLRNKEKNGYAAVQLAFDAVEERKVNKPRLGQFKKSQTPAQRFVREIRTENLQGLTVGAQVGVENFEVGDFVDVMGISIGKGFQGVVKRHHFKGGHSGHGSMFGRVPGSIGASSFPSRVVKGMRAAGHLGDHRATLQNLRVVKVDLENQLLAVRGSVPGVEGGYLVVRTAVKRGKSRAWKVRGTSQPSEKQSGSTEEKS